MDKINLKEEEYLYIKKSQIPRSGQGLFTTIDIYKGEIIAKYRGKKISQKKALELADEHKDAYFIELLDGRILDCANHFCYASKANDTKGISKTSFKNNAEILIGDDDIIPRLVASKKIKAGEEIFTSYGAAYWRNVMKRIKNK